MWLKRNGKTGGSRPARRLQRDYKNVYHDAQALERVGLIVRTADKRLSAPWEKVVAEISLAEGTGRRAGHG